MPVLCFMLSRVGSAEVHSFHNRDPKVQEAETRDHPPHCAVHQKRGYMRKIVNELIVCPQRCVPGKHQYNHADVDADDDVKVQLHPAQPERNPGGSLRRGLPFLNGRAVLGTGRKQVRLLRHFPWARAKRGAPRGWSKATVTQRPEAGFRTGFEARDPLTRGRRQGL